MSSRIGYRNGLSASSEDGDTLRRQWVGPAKRLATMRTRQHACALACHVGHVSCQYSAHLRELLANHGARMVLD